MGPGRIHITGASGAGVTTLGRALAQAYAVPHFDIDDIYWMPTAEPFTEKRPEAERVALLEMLMGERRHLLLSGSITGWGDALAQRFDAVVFVRTAARLRLERLRAREALRHGTLEIREDGRRFLPTQSFLRWAERYDDPDFTGRSLAGHRRWLAGLACPVVEVDGGRPMEALTAQVVRALNGFRQSIDSSGERGEA